MVISRKASRTVPNMKPPVHSLALRSFILILIIDVIESIAELCFKSATTATGIHNVTLANLLTFTSRLIGSGLLWVGIGCFILIFCLWMLVLTKVDLSVAFPLGNAVCILIPLLAIVVLHERVSPLRWVGILLVVVGGSCVSISAATPQKPCV